MGVFSKEFCEEMHQRLLQERQQLEREIANLATTGTQSGVFQDDEGTDTVDQHPADEGSELFEREKNLALERNAQESLQAVNEALHRFETGTYGICAECGEPIPEARLRALPEATTCVKCQARLEKQHTATR